MKLLSLVDASSILYRSFFALPPMSSSTGQPTQALFGFSKFLLKQMQEPAGEYTLVAFDGLESKKRRTELWPAYKAHRQKAPDDLRSQMDLAPQLCRALGWPQLQQQGEEADDIIASACRWALSQGARALIFSQDKDLLQLVGKEVQVIAIHKGSQPFDIAAVRAQFGVLPNQLGDWLALVGDASDNIPGVPGIGPKKAAQLLGQFGDLSAVLANAGQIGGAVGKALGQHADQARLSRQLVELITDIPTRWSWSDLQFRPPDKEICEQLFNEWNFQSLLNKLARHSSSSAGPAPIISAPKGALGEQNPSPTNGDLAPKVSSRPWQHVGDLAQWHALFDHLRQHRGARGVCALQFAEREGSTKRGQIPTCIALCIGGENWTLDVQVLRAAGFKLHHLLQALFVESARTWATDNSKDWCHLVLQHAPEISPALLLQISFFDVLLANYVLQKRDYAPSPIRLSEAALAGQSPTESARERAHQIAELAEQLPNELAEQQVQELFEQIERPLVPILALMEHWGIQLDCAQLQHQREQVVNKLRQLESEITQLAGETFNLNSPKQLAQILFDRLGLRPPKKIATGFSTDAATLEILRSQHPIASQLLEYRALEKLRSTYIEALPQCVNPSTGRIHPSFMQMVTATGRLSCQEPNLQNIPIKSPWGRLIRSAFVAKEGHSFVSADYSQIELRLMAHFSEDEAMIDAFQRDLDIHVLTASEIFQISPEKVTKSQRSQAKTVNFGIIYGQQAFGLAGQLGIDRKTAESFIRAYFARYPGVARYIEKCKRALETSHVVQTLFGRQRVVKGHVATRDKNLAHRLAINSPIQGTGADLMKLAMIRVQTALNTRHHSARMLLQIHDELLFECPRDQIDSLVGICVPILQNVAALRVPLIVNVDIGNNWAEC